MTDKQAAQQIVRDYYLSGATTHAELEEIICEALGKAREQGRAELQAEQDGEWERLMKDLKAARGEYQPIVDESPTLERVEGDEVGEAVGAELVEQVDQAVISPTPEQIRERLVAASKNLHARCYRGPYNCDSPAWEGRLFERCDVCEARDLIGHVLSLLDQRDAEIAKLAVIAGNWKLATGGFEALKELGKQAASLLRRMTEEVARLREDRNLAQTAAAEWRDKLAEVTVKLEEHKDCVKQATHAFAVRYAEQMTEERDAYKRDFEAELDGNAAIRARYGALDSESFIAFVGRLHAERDKWLDNFNRSEEFQNGPTKRAEAAESSLARLTEAHERIKRENAAIRKFSEIHDGGCQSPHGGKCGCGWSLIEARLEELSGEETPERVAWLRSTVKITHPEDRLLVDEVLADLDALLAPPEEKKAVNGDR